ncbi:MAG: tetratricopeptide repeat protein [Gammaproteobacteria bacterium]|nr:tetratricopeptide repeat protein [Gammaproteobacteria bacterium]
MAKSNILHRSKLKKVKQFIENNDFDSAEKILIQLARKAPRDAEIWLYRGYVEGFRNEHVKAAEFFKKSLEIKPDDSSILYNYGIALRDSGDYLAAANAFKKSLLKDSENTQKLDCLAHVYMMLNDHEKAIETFGRSLRINPGQPETHSNLGSVYQAQGELSRAEACYRKALQLNPSLNIYDNLGSVLVSQGRYKESIEVYRAGLIKQPKNTRVFSNLLLTLNYMEDVSQQELYDEHNKWGDTFDNPLNYIAHHACDKNKEVLRIGYYSPDFREHSVAYFIEPIIEYHDKNKFKTYAYYSSKKEDAVTARLKGFFDVWRDASVMTDSELADAVKSDEIDIMVDLTGHTASNALLAFAKKPAPVQITYLGYPNTTGMKAIQYRITDAIADPEGQDIFYSEELCRLPECFLTYKPDDNSPDVSEPPVIQNGFITFGSFNNLAKINDKVIDVWCRILKRLPDSKLLVKNPSLTDLKTRETYIKKFQQFGIEGNRINLIGHTPTRNEHLSLYDKIDIALDTFPYNGTTTTCEALWMGVPVVALCGDYHAARVGASLLTAVNQKDLITNSEEEYIDKAASLAKNTDLLKYNRDRQRDYLQKSILFDGRAFVVSLENEYQRIWKSHS